MEFSVIIPARNEEEFIGDAIRSVVAQTVPRECVEIIVVSNASSDNTTARATAAGADLIVDEAGGSGRGHPTGRGPAAADRGPTGPWRGQAGPVRLPRRATYLYGPLIGAEPMRYHGAPVEVDQVLKNAPPLEEMPGRAGRAAAIASRDPVVRVLADRKMLKRNHGDGMISVACSFASGHTEPGSETSTAYFLPNFGGVKYGKFVCKHMHCAARKQEDFLTALGLDPREVWREQAGGTNAVADLRRLAVQHDPRST